MTGTTRSPAWNEQNLRRWPEMITLSALIWIGSKSPLARIDLINSAMSGSSIEGA